MHFWDLTIDTVTTIILVLAVGLSVDYASHIAHTFMVISGTRSGESFLLSNDPSLKGLRRGNCPIRFGVKTVLKSNLSTFCRTRDGPRTPSGTYKVIFSLG